MRCPYCGTPKFRTSKLRIGDFPRLALLQFPLRCKVCRERFYGGLGLALNILQAERVRKQERLDSRFKENGTHEKHA